MLVPLLAILMMSHNRSSPNAPMGSIQGVVVNGTRGSEPVADAEVTLRAGPNGLLEAVEITKTDLYGKFTFSDLPLAPAIVYLPGANCNGVHYPGQRVHLDPNNRIAHVKIVMFNAVASPSRLNAARHDIEIEVEERALAVTETLVVSNPSRETYVGESSSDAPPVTLRLSVPEDFDRVTFENEFYGRRFRIVDGRLVTDIPWLPGNARLRFAYRIPLAKTAGHFRRPLDLPSSNVTIRLRKADRLQASCNLSSRTTDGEYNVFTTADTALPAGYTVDLQIENLRTPWAQHARWGAIATLGMLILSTRFLGRRNGAALQSRKPVLLPKPGGTRAKSSRRAA